MRLAMVLVLVLATSVAWAVPTTEAVSPGGTLEWQPAKEVEVKWTQLPDLDGYVLMSQDMYDQAIYAECADDFYCDDGSPIVGIEWWGAYWNYSVLPPYAEYFIIRFYDDVPAPPFSHPGNIVYEEPCYVYTEEPDPNEFHFHYYQDLGMPFDQVEDTIYWVSIVAVYAWFYPDSGGGGQWGWAECLPEYYWNDEMCFFSPYFGYYEWTPATEVYGVHREMAFVLYADVMNPVEATTWGQVKAMFR